MSAYRCEGGRGIDRSRPLQFEFDGQRYTGFMGDTLASALLANGVNLLGRSFKRHRPRGVLSAGLEEPNALVTLEHAGRRQPNLRATEVQLHEGLRARSQNRWPSLKHDLGGVLDRMAGFLPPSFYHKTFKWPSWGFYEPWVRRVAGLGPPPLGAPHEHYDRRYLDCEVLVVGAGPSGLVAAAGLAEQGVDVCLVEEQPSLGGALAWSEEDQAAHEALIRSLHQADNVRVLTSTCAFGAYEHGTVAALQRCGLNQQGEMRRRLWRIRAQRTLFACGAVERPLVFGNNDLPGIMLADAVRRYAVQYGVLCGRTAVIATNNDSAYRCALVLSGLGVKITAVVDSREEVADHLVTALGEAGIELVLGSAPALALGRQHVSAVEIHRPGKASGRRTLDCDLLAVSGGWSPNVQLFSHAQGVLRFDENIQGYRPDGHTSLVRCVGSANGCFGRQELRNDALEAAQWACDERAETLQVPGFDGADNGLDFTSAKPLLTIPEGHFGRMWVDFQHDVTVRDLRVAVAEGMSATEHLKRYTTAGMSVDQGKTGSHATLRVLAEETGRSLDSMRPTTYRPPYHPVKLAALAGGARGARYRALHRLPARQWHLDHGAHLVEEGGWERPSHYSVSGESSKAAREREIRAVRNGVAVFDSSSLGKIEVRGPDACRFLERIYFNRVDSLAESRARYGLMLDERGGIINDGIFTRLGENHYLVFTTSGGADAMYRRMRRYHAVEWPDLDLALCAVTEHWASLTLSGPRAREVMSNLPSDIDFSNEAFPHMSIRQGRIKDMPARVLRASYTGELQYEVNVPGHRATDLLDLLWASGQDAGVCGYGLEAQALLRLEKGFIEYGIDTLPETIPQDIGFPGRGRYKDSDFIGRRSLEMNSMYAQGRLELVGLESESLLPVGAHAVAGEQGVIPQPSLGFVTSSANSPTLERPVALALIRSGKERSGETLTFYSRGGWYEARLTRPGFFDPSGERAMS